MGMTEKIPVKREDLYEFQFLSEASLSPDGRYAAYVVTQADKEKNGYNSAIWMYDLETGKNRRMAERGGAKGILWLDEKSFLFASDRGEAPDKESAVYYRLSVDGGEAQSFLTLPHKAEKILAGVDHIADCVLEEKEEGMVSAKLKTDRENIYDASRALFLAFAQENTPLLEMTLKKANLEEIFLELTETSEPAPAGEEKEEETA